MQNLPSRCPLCGGEVTVTRIYCRDCDTTIEGRFAPGGSFGQLRPEQLAFVELFVRCEGRLNRLADELKLSYPTVRNRLNEIIRAMGYEPGGEEAASGMTDDQRQKILDDLDAGLINYEEAVRKLKESEA
jgi:hypothetical protein